MRVLASLFFVLSLSITPIAPAFVRTDYSIGAGLTLTPAPITQTTYTSSSLVIVKLNDISDTQWSELVSKVHGTNGMTSEYFCKESEVFVIRYRHNFTEKADVEQYIMSKMKAWTRMKLCEIIYVDISSAEQKC